MSASAHCAMGPAGIADIAIGTLNCSPGTARLETSRGDISVDSLDGRAQILSQSHRESAKVTVHAQDNLETLFVKAECPVKLGLSPALMKKALCSMESSSQAIETPEGIRMEPSQDSAALRTYTDLKQQAQDVSNEDAGLPKDGSSSPSIHITTKSSISAYVESWIDSLARRTKRT